MYQNIVIESLDHYGRGIAHIDSKVVFVENALPDEIVDIEVTSSKKKFSLAKVVKYIKISPKRIDSKCLYFGMCGGCNLLNLQYDNTLDFKLNKIRELLTKNRIIYNGNFDVIENKNKYNYRNKISLKIVNGKIGFFQDKTHDLVMIYDCLVAHKVINKIIKNYKLLNVQNGELIVRVNSNDEVLLIIKSNDNNYDIELGKLKELVKLVGIVYNDKTIFGDNFFYERVGGFLFKVSYNSFFQVNRYICEVLFNLIKDKVLEDDNVLDLYCGVGTLGIVASKKAKSVIGIEIIENAVLNGVFNAQINKCNNIKFMLGDVSKTVNKLNIEFDTLIVDPPRKGLDYNTIQFIKDNKFKKIIYVSCDPNTLMRDLKSLSDIYKIDEYKVLDMFSYSYHVESFCLLEYVN